MKVIKGRDNSITFFSITPENEIVISGDSWREKRTPDGLPIYGSCKSGKLANREQAESVLNLIIGLL
jgi:hypothetical protein